MGIFDVILKLPALHSKNFICSVPELAPVLL